MIEGMYVSLHTDDIKKCHKSVTKRKTRDLDCYR